MLFVEGDIWYMNATWSGYLSKSVWAFTVCSPVLGIAGEYVDFLSIQFFRIYHTQITIHIWYELLNLKNYAKA
jgi:hypothetical protein